MRSRLLQSGLLVSSALRKTHHLIICLYLLCIYGYAYATKDKEFKKQKQLRAAYYAHL